MSAPRRARRGQGRRRTGRPAGRGAAATARTVPARKPDQSRRIANARAAAGPDGVLQSIWCANLTAGQFSLNPNDRELGHSATAGTLAPVTFNIDSETFAVRNLRESFDPKPWRVQYRPTCSRTAHFEAPRRKTSPPTRRVPELAPRVDDRAAPAWPRRGRSRDDPRPGRQAR